MADYPLINGHKYDFSSISIDLGSQGGIVVGIKEITFSHSLEPGIVRGTRAEKLARTRGEYDAEGSIVFYAGEHEEFVAALSQNNSVGYMEQSFDITLSYSTPNQPTMSVKLFGCRITSEEGGGSQGTDPLEVSCDLNIMRVQTNGANPITNQLI